MSYIPCSSDCKFQNDGLCSLNYAGGAGTDMVYSANNLNGCLHYIPRNSVLRSAQFHEARSRYSIPKQVSDL